MKFSKCLWNMSPLIMSHSKNIIFCSIPRTLMPLLVRVSPGMFRFMCHVSHRFDCPLKDIVINALCVIARRWESVPRQSATQDIHLHESQISLMHFNNTEVLGASQLFSHIVTVVLSEKMELRFNISFYISYVLSRFWTFGQIPETTGLRDRRLCSHWLKCISCIV